MREGIVLSPRELPTIAGEPVRIPDPEQLVHLQFRRYAGCPICNLHLHEFAARFGELEAAGVREVVVFHSDRRRLQAYGSDLPFDMVPDPAKTLYREFGVERSWRSLANPVTWMGALRGWSRRTTLWARTGGHLGLPADFLIAPNGQLVAVKYGRNASDHWSADQVLDTARQWTA
jgi:peroxiredoxin